MATVDEQMIASQAKVCRFTVEVLTLETSCGLTNTEYLLALSEMLYRRLDASRLDEIRGKRNGAQ